MVKQEYGIKEFDDLMHEVEKMKDQIRNLIDNVVEKEKNIQRIEYEKLLFQINPHFLLNTLNSIQWMARMSHQDNITEFVQRLKKLLSYNLGKEGMQTTLRTEIDIVKEYIALQQMRYDFVIEMNVEEGLLAGNSGRGRTGNLCGHRESCAGLDGLLPTLCAGWHSVCRRRKRRGRNRRSCCTGASLSDGQGGVSHGI